MRKSLIQRWQTKRGKHWIELYMDDMGFTYRGDDCGGNLGNIDLHQAKAKIQELLDSSALDGFHLYPVNHA